MRLSRCFRCSVACVAMVAVCLAMGLIEGSAAAYPKPAVVPYQWELEFEPGPLRLYFDETDGSAYWYFTYMVTNRTGRDIIWAPTLTLFTDRGEIVPSGRDVPVRVTRTIMGLLGNDLLETQNQIIGDLLQGPTHAKEGVVIWPASSLNVNEMSLFIAGMSGETARVKDPVTGEEYILRKTLHRKYLIPGDMTARGSSPAELIEEAWILR